LLAKKNMISNENNCCSKHFQVMITTVDRSADESASNKKENLTTYIIRKIEKYITVYFVKQLFWL
jgi:hypothetical protein